MKKLPDLRSITREQIGIIDFPNNVGVYGDAGTGKTVVAMWRHIRNLEKEKKSYLITFTHTLTYVFEKLFPFYEKSNIENFDQFWKDFQSGTLPPIDELIIDEAQDIAVEKHEEIAKYFNVSYCASDQQELSYQGIGASEQELEEIYRPKQTRRLMENFRNSRDILEFVKNLFPGYIDPETIAMIQYEDKPHLYIVKNREEIIKNIQYIIENIRPKKTIAILLPTVRLLDKYRNMLTDLGYQFSSYDYRNEGDIRDKGIMDIHLTTFHSSKGLEFDSVIVPEFQLFRPDNKYFVALTRAKSELHLISEHINPIQYISTELYINETLSTN